MSSEVWATLVPPLRRFAYSLTGHQADADDLLQSTMERLLVKGMPEDIEPLKWAFKVCRNLWIDEYRARKVRQSSPIEDHVDELKTDGEASVSAQIEMAEVNRAFMRLSEEHQSVLSLLAVHSMSYKEIAETLALPIGTVMSRVARARSALADALFTHKARSPSC